MRTLLHAVAVVLTVLLLLIRPRYTFAAVCYNSFTFLTIRIPERSTEKRMCVLLFVSCLNYLLLSAQSASMYLEGHEKRIPTPFIPNSTANFLSPSLNSSCNDGDYFVHPKYKRDPKIELDDEDIEQPYV